MERILTDKMNYLFENKGCNVYVMTTDQLGREPYFHLNQNVSLINLDLNFNQFFEKNILVKYLETKKLLKTYKKLLVEFIIHNNIDICISLGGKELEFLYQLDLKCKKVCELHFNKNIRKQFLESRSKSFFWKIIGQYRTAQLVSQTKRLDLLVVLTKDDENEWLKTNDNVVQIYNFSTLSPEKVSSLTNKRAIAVGRLDAQKGFDMLIDAWKLVNVENKEWKLDIYGKGEWHNQLSDKINEYGLSGIITLRGVNSEIENELLDSSLFILSSRYEGFPMVLLESISCGLPIVSFDCKTGPSEIIEDNDCGILVPAEDVSELAKGIIKVINDPQRLRHMAFTSKLKSLKFSKEEIMDKWYDTFKNILTS
ncbi:glycosyltransferase family 4 protein [Sphingobacterium multivorum]|uniref:glycosyltransferase family 4 protein n=1 Tax=Sphingobacterium multivorum TaxID=28454 RepID=UPI0028A9D630|nr:glycosyltransferase family 4 protein [Sphingobacterium multivorum]